VLGEISIYFSISGAHTFGRARCLLFKDRLYDFNNTGQPDPTLNTVYLQQLQIQCPQNGSGDNTRVAFDPVTPGRLDKQFYNNLQAKKGLLQSDQELFSTPNADTISIVNSFANNESFFFEHFTKSIIKMGNIGVLTGTRGEIRKQCNFVNKKSSEFDHDIESLEEEDMVSSI
jgi:peroxidase